MSNYVIFTDSACDIAPAILKEWGVEHIELSFRFQNEDREYLNNEMDIKEFYNRMRDGETAKTAAANPEQFMEAFEKILKEGKDILYLGFSSGLSTTFNSARYAASELGEKYKDRKILTLDTLCASSGQGLLVYLAAKQRDKGESIEEVAVFVERNKLNLCHWFTVDDLVYLKRGGRISPTLAFVGSVLGIKPVLHVDDAGKLVSVSKARGRKAALNALADKYGELAKDTKNGTIFICQADCMEDAKILKATLKEKYKADVKMITNTGAVIGAHSGPGTIAIFFIGKER
ncbi:MAG: DegV family protein [Clostridia bacterium]|nr:DegV family protein [Clostridia bacterium]